MGRSSCVRSSAMAHMLKKKTDPTPFELEVGKIFEKTELGLAHLYFNSAKEIELAEGRKVAVIYFPMPLIEEWKKVLNKEKRGMFKPKGLQKRPSNRTLFAVYDEILAD